MTAEVIQLHAKGTPAPATEGGLARAAAQQRLQLTLGAEHLLADLRPHVTREHMSLGSVAAYFRVDPWRVDALLAEFRVELSEVGYRPDTGFTRRAVLHMALLLPLNVSERADVLKRTLGAWVGRPGGAAPLTTHEQMCRELIGRAAELAEDVQDGDPGAVWAEVSGMGRHELQGVVVALAAMLPLDQAGLRAYLTRLGLSRLRADGVASHPSRAAAAGLATLVPEAGSQ